MEINEILDNFKGKKILVIGDIILDKYVEGKVSRISPEAPIQIVEVEKESFMPGGAGNSANNIVRLGGKAFIIGVVGDDHYGEHIVKLMEESNINTQGIIKDNRKTILKERITSKGQQLLRVDYEGREKVNSGVDKKVAGVIDNIANEIDCVLVSDYDKGMITEKIMKKIKEKFKDNIIIVDPRPRNKKLYENVMLITPNMNEAKEMANKERLDDVGKSLIEELKSNVLITKGEEGMTLFDKDGSIVDMPTRAIEVYDIAGAGDTVLAAISLALASGADLKEAAEIANHAAGVVVGKSGTATATIEEIKKSFKNGK